MPDPFDEKDDLTTAPESGTERQNEASAAAHAEASAGVGNDGGPTTGSAGELDNLRAEKAALYERLARAQADFQNSRRRLESETAASVQYQVSKLLNSLLPVIDNFERALAVNPATTDVAGVLKGMQLVHDQWLTILKQQNVEPIAPAGGDAFDPHQHQAVMQQESDLPEGSVVQTAQKGYTLNGKPLRPASVVVAK